MALSGPIGVALGVILLVFAAVLAFTVLPIANEAISTYAAGPDGTAGNTDDPPASQVSLANLMPLSAIGTLAISGIALLVGSFRSIRG